MVKITGKNQIENGPTMVKLFNSLQEYEQRRSNPYNTKTIQNDLFNGQFLRQREINHG